MKIVSFHVREDAFPHTGAVSPTGEVLDFDHPATGLPARTGPFDWLDEDGEHLKAARALLDALAGDVARVDALREAGAVCASEDLCMAAPVPRPGKFICIGLNYKDHAEESGMDIPERPLVFSKWSSCVVGPDHSVLLPKGSTEVDYEAEFAFVIGRRAWRISEDEAMDHVLGYTCVNDVSARDFQFADGQWQRGKSCETFAPMGPWLVTRDEIDDPHDLAIKIRIDGRTLQDSSTNQLIFGIPRLVSELSQAYALEPGDVISTGTPPGVGFARKPPVYLHPGMSMEVEIEGIGILRNGVIGSEEG